jgi:hypothetical protein
MVSIAMKSSLSPLPARRGSARLSRRAECQRHARGRVGRRRDRVEPQAGKPDIATAVDDNAQA